MSERRKYVKNIASSTLKRKLICLLIYTNEAADLHRKHLVSDKDKITLLLHADWRAVQRLRRILLNIFRAFNNVHE